MIATQISNHTQLLNYLTEKYNLKSYLEIGVQNPANNFNKINVLHKVGVDPELPASRNIIGLDGNGFTSDQAFAAMFTAQYPPLYDLIFIDGLHHADQVERDFENSLRCLNDGGFIVIHDTMPEDESTTHVPRDSKMWHGDVYKFAMNIGTYTGINYVTVDMDCGCTVVWKDKEQMTGSPYDTSWENYVYFKKTALNIIAPTEIEQYF